MLSAAQSAAPEHRSAGREAAGRPPIAQERLDRLADGRLRFTMKKPWRDGTSALVFEPLDLIGRLCATVPPPWFHLTRFHGVLASAAALRAQVVPSPPPGSELGPSSQDEQLELFGPTVLARPTRKPWAWLLRHVFAEDVTVC
ncbi:MAG: transposase, partial [Deltaproteobacteria bacterium]|nr:transposase [Deltaproteobacteria bacterium]